jgi:hypothetical protein
MTNEDESTPIVGEFINEEDIPDDALAEIARLSPNLNSQERKYIYWRSVANPPALAFSKAGYTGSSWRMVETRPKIREALIALNEELEPAYRVTQKTVVGILMEAVDMARMKEQPKVMVEAAKELAAVTGVGEAAKIQIDQRTEIQLSAREEVKALRHMPRWGLEDLVGVQRALPPSFVEAEFEEVEPSGRKSE